MGCVEFSVGICGLSVFTAKVSPGACMSARCRPGASFSARAQRGAAFEAAALPGSSMHTGLVPGATFSTAFVCITPKPYLAVEPTVIWVQPGELTVTHVSSNTDWQIE